MTGTNTAEIPLHIQFKEDGNIGGVLPEAQRGFFYLLKQFGFRRLDFSQPASLAKHSLSAINESQRNGLEFQATLTTSGRGLHSAMAKYGGLPRNIRRLIVPFNDEQILQLIENKPDADLKGILLGISDAKARGHQFEKFARVRLDPQQAEALPYVAKYCYSQGFNGVQALVEVPSGTNSIQEAMQHIALTFPETKFVTTAQGVEAITEGMNLELLDHTSMSIAGKLCRQCALSCNLKTGGITLGTDGFIGACENPRDRFDVGLTLGNPVRFAESMQKIVVQNF
jgi:hypothetical protein